jgi:rhamnose transport system permease protein
VREWLSARSWTALLAAVLVVSFVFNVGQSEGYLSVSNFVNLFELSIEKIIVVVVMTFVIVAGEIDLSVASVMGFTACVAAGLHEHGVLPFSLIVVISLAVAATVGLVHGLLVTKLGLPSLVVTLAGLIGWRGAARVLVEDRSVGDFPEWFDALGQNDLLGPLPFSIVLFLVLLAAGAVILLRTDIGRYLYVIGDNTEVARFAGVAVDRVRRWLFVASSTTAGVAGLLFASRLGTARADLANGYELEIITVVLLGGVSIFGGSGRMSGVALAILIFLNIRNGLGLAGIDGTTQTGVIGVILIASVIAQHVFERLEVRRRTTAKPTTAAGVGA